MHDREERVFQSIGSLATKIANLPASSASTPSPSATSSEPTGARSLAPKPSNSTGRQPIKIAAASLADAIATNDPETVDSALTRSLPACVSSNLRPLARTFVDPKYGFDFRFAGYTLDGAIEPGPALDEALAMVEFACKPASKQVIQTELARLWVMTKKRADDSNTLVAAAYAEELAPYPADIVVSSLRRWARVEKFWPAWSELYELLEERFERRRALREALQRRGQQ